VDVATIQLNCFGGRRTYASGPAVQHAFGTIDLGAEREFLAWCVIGYLNGLYPGSWDFDNAVVGEVYAIDFDTLDATAYGAKLENWGSMDNLHHMALRSRGRWVTFRLRVYDPKEMEAAMKGIVLYDL
jgi:hypothetical protein